MGKIKHRILSGILKERELRITSMGHRVMGLSVSRKCMVIGVWFLFTAAISLSLMYGSALLLDRYGLCIYRISRYSIVDCPLKYYPLELIFVRFGPIIVTGVSAWYLIFRLRVFFRPPSKYEEKNQLKFDESLKSYYREKDTNEK